MTDGNPRPDEELTPPASTRWSRETDDAEEELAPPFVPGGTREAASEAGPGEAAAPASEAPAEPGAGAGEGEEDGAFPFEAGWDAAEAEDEEPVGAEDDFPFEAFDIEGDELEAVETEEADPWAGALPAAEEDEQGDLEEPWAEAAVTEEPTAEPMDPWAEAPPTAGEEEATEEGRGALEEPWAETPSGEGEAAEAGEGGEAEPWAVAPVGEETPAEASEPAAGGDVDELADRLEALAQRLRAEGAGAAEAEMSSPDRFTALLAGLLAGYLAGR